MSPHLKFDIWKTLFTMRVVRHWSRLSREAMHVSFVEVFKARTYGTWSNLVEPDQGKCPCPRQGSWNYMVFRGPFQPKQFCESIIQFRTLKELEKTCDGVNEVTGGLHGELYTLTGQQSCLQL